MLKLEDLYLGGGGGNFVNFYFFILQVFVFAGFYSCIFKLENIQCLMKS